MKEYVLSSPALNDLDEIWSHLANYTVRGADRIRANILSQCQRLAEMPTLGAHYDEEIGIGLLYCTVRKKYVIYYRISPHGIDVIRILHGARDRDTILGHST